MKGGILRFEYSAVGQVAGFDEIRAYNLAKLEKRLPVRTWLVLLQDGKSMVEKCFEVGLVSGVGDDMLRHRYLNQSVNVSSDNRV